MENNELRLKLKACLDEFDALEAQDKADNLTQQNESDNLTEGKKDSESATTEASEKEKVCMYVHIYIVNVTFIFINLKA